MYIMFDVIECDFHLFFDQEVSLVDTLFKIVKLSRHFSAILFDKVLNLVNETLHDAFINISFFACCCQQENIPVSIVCTIWFHN